MPDVDVLADLLLLADLGWRLVPCEGKRPRVDGWQAAATSDPDAIRAWCGRWPGATWGVATGAPSGVWVLDVDRSEALDELRALGVNLPDTVQARSGREGGGGRHFYFAGLMPAGLSRGRLPAGIDVRAGGGLIIVPPSLHASGRRYAWVQGRAPWERPPAAAPVELLDLLRPAPPARPQRAPSMGLDDDRARGDLGRRARAWLARVPGAVSGQGGHAATFRTASALVNGWGLSEGEALALLSEWNGRCDPPWEPRDLEHKVASAADAGPPAGKPFGWLADDAPPLRYSRPGPGATSHAVAAEPAPDLDDELEDARPVAAPFLPASLRAEGYRWREGRVWRVGGKEPQLVARAPVWVEAVALDDDGRSLVRLAWTAGGQKRTATVRRSEAVTAAGLRLLADRRVPVDEATARPLAGYLGAWVAELELRGGGVRVTARAGWHGEAWLPPGADLGELRHEAADGCAEWASHAGQARGGLDGWARVVRLLRRADAPAVSVTMAAALAAPLLRWAWPSDAGGFAVQLAGPRGTGKSSLLRAAAAVWGAPGLVGSWADRPAGREAWWNGHGDGWPCLMDDAEQADPADLESAVYAWAEGRGRRRATTTGRVAAEPARWRSVLMTTGEAPITSGAARGGAHRRVLVLPGRALPPGAGELLDALRDALDGAHGVAGPRWIAHLADPENRRAVLDAADWRARILAGPDADGVRRSMALAFGLVWACGEAGAALGLVPWSDAHGEAAWNGIASEAESGADRALAALRRVLAHLEANPARVAYPGRDGLPPAAGWIGVVSGRTVGIVPSEAERVLRDGGFRRDDVLREWRDRGWIACEPRALTARVRAGDGRLTCHAFRRSELRALGLDPFDDGQRLDGDLDEGALPEAPSGPPTAPMHAEAPRPAPTPAAPSWADTGPIPTAAETATAGGALRRELAIMAPAANGPDYSTASSTRPPKGQALSAPPVSPDAGPPTLDDLDDLAAEPRRTDELPDLAADGAGADLDDDDEGSEA